MSPTGDRKFSFVTLMMCLLKATSWPRFLYLAQERSTSGKHPYKDKRIQRTGSVSYVSCGKCYNGNRKTAAAPGN